MRTKLKGLIREEAGAALVLTLVLLLIGGLIIAPLLGHMGTGHTAGQVHEKRMDEFYAADAGVEMAIWQITNDPSAPVEPMILNDKYVEVEIEMVECRKYRITSNATTPQKSSSIVVADLWALTFLDNAITSKQNVRIQSNSNVFGNVQYGGTLSGDGDIHGEIIHEEFAAWPTWQELYAYYYGKYVEDQTGFEYRSGNGEILVKDYLEYGVDPLHWTGDLDITNSPPDGVAGAILRLDGTLYIDGHLSFPQPGNRHYSIDLNGQTIFVEGGVDFPSDSVSITGSGSIIAVWDIDFQPHMSSNPDDFVLVLSLRGNVNFQPGGSFTGFIMSVEQTVDFKPKGDFAGSVAGDVNVDLLPNITLTWKSILDADIDFPFDDFSMWRLRSYNIHTETG